VDLFESLSAFQAPVQAALVGAVAGLVTSTGTSAVTARLQRRRQDHEITLEGIKVALTQQLRDYEKEIQVKLAESNALLQKQLARFSAEIPQQKRIKEHMSKTRTLLRRVFVSFDRLSRLATLLTEAELLSETTNTLEVYAEYQRHLASDEEVSYPSELRENITSANVLLSRICLELQAHPSSNRAQATNGIRSYMKVLEQFKNDISRQVEDRIRVQMDA